MSSAQLAIEEKRGERAAANRDELAKIRALVGPAAPDDRSTYDLVADLFERYGRQGEAIARMHRKLDGLERARIGGAK